LEEDTSSKIVEADDDFNEGAATHPVLNEAKQQEGVTSGAETTQRKRKRERKLNWNEVVIAVYYIVYIIAHPVVLFGALFT
jgi:hypothetical protein